MEQETKVQAYNVPYTRFSQTLTLNMQFQIQGLVCLNTWQDVQIALAF